jgi:hypothetical protein
MLSKFLEGTMFLRNIKSQYLSLSVMRNEENNQIMKNKLIDTAFLYYRYYLEVDPAPGVSYENFVQHVKALINFLRAEGMHAIPACDFEDILNDGKPVIEFMK